MTDNRRLRELEEKYEGYTVYDNAGEKIGKVDDLFVDDTDRDEYIGVRMGLFGLSGTTMIPMDIARVNERDRTIEVAESKDHVKDAPNYSDDDEVTTEFEDRIRRHFGLEGMESSAGGGTYDRYVAGSTTVGADTTTASAGTTPVSNEFRGEHDTEDRPSGAPMSGTEERDRTLQESYRNREDMGSESAMGSPGAGEATPSGGMRDLETDESGRADSDDVVGGMTRGHREEPGEREDLDPSGTMAGAGPIEEGGTQRRGAGKSGSEDYRDLTPPGDTEGDRSSIGDESYREGLREGLREGFRQGLREGRGEPGHEGQGERQGERTGLEDDAGSSGEPTTGLGGTEAGDRGYERGGSEERAGGATGPGDETRQMSQRSSEEGTREEESAPTRVWRRVRRSLET